MTASPAGSQPRSQPGSESASAVTWRGEPAWRLQHASGAHATIALHGANLLSWCGAGGAERLYLSPATRHGAGEAVRGGVPVIFPKFAQRGPDTALPKHGFARSRAWQRVDDAETDGAGERGGDGDDGTAAAITLRLADDAETRALWPHSFELDLTLRLAAKQLVIDLRCRNAGPDAFAFNCALHSYFAVEQLDATTLAGLHGARRQDLGNGHEDVESAEVIAFDGSEIDRIHWAAGTRDLVLAEPGRRLRIRSSGWPDVVVWNPGPVKAAQMSDLTPGDERRFVCVEGAAVEPRIVLAPGAVWQATQRLSIEDGAEGRRAGA